MGVATCPKCGFDGVAGSAFCEACGETVASPMGSATVGAPIAVPDVCSCGAGADKLDAHHVCTVCGEITTPVTPRDRFRLRLDARCGASSDLGRKHWRNEDYVAMATEAIEGERLLVTVVSDGVSSSEHPDQASQSACQSALQAAFNAARCRAADESVVREAILAAQDAVLRIPHSGDHEPPEATILVMLQRGDTATLGWLGDSRAYGVTRRDGEVTATLLTEDHSWINEVVNAGEMTLDQALLDKRSHAVTQSLGDLPPGESLEPSIRVVPLDGVSMLVGCTDGFWNYAHPRQDEPPQPLAELVRAAPETQEAVDFADACVRYANDHGGHDNVTVAVIVL